MTSVNQVILTGKVANEPLFHYQPDGTPVLQFPLELNDSEKDSQNRPDCGRLGQVSKRKGFRTNLIHVVVLGKLAQCGAELQSGQHLLVKGRLHQRRWQTPEGRNRSLTEVIASELHRTDASETDLGIGDEKQ